MPAFSAFAKSVRSTSIRLPFPKTLFTHALILIMIVLSFLFLFYLLASAFTCKILNLLLGTGKALLFLCVLTSYHMSLMWTTGFSLAAFFAP